MKFSTYYLFVITIMVMFAYTHAQCGAGTIPCGTGECYNPLIQRCFPQSNHICPIAFHLCGSECYNPDNQRCFPGNILCPVSNRLCGSECYNPFNERCFPGNIRCPVSNSLCGTACYNPINERCFPGNIRCPVSNSICESECYNPTVDQCVDGDVIPITGGECGTCGTGTCGTGLCFNPSTHTCLSGTTVCPINFQLCGSSCYNPTTHDCFGTGELELISTGPGPQPPPPSTCGVGEALCGNQCYVVSQYRCINGNHLCNCGAPNFCPGQNACFKSADYSCCGTTDENSRLFQGQDRCATGQNRAITAGVGCP